ncbi:MAG: hypothetical protein K0S32_2408 [Bacteroidetes bacterium]|jgi:hypothetical protein|nr:hypothetical protein [Bacteroidota bacterium]
MTYYAESSLGKLGSYIGKVLDIDMDNRIYFLKFDDMSGELVDEIYNQVKNSDDEYGDKFEIENYHVFACNGVKPGGILSGEGISTIYALNFETLCVIKISNGDLAKTFETMDGFLRQISGAMNKMPVENRAPINTAA